MSLKLLEKNLLIGLICIALLYFFIGRIMTGWIFRFYPIKKELPSSNKLQLTLEDEIDPVYTPMLLDLLKNNQVKASFVIRDSSAKKYPNLVRRMKKEGHTVGKKRDRLTKEVDGNRVIYLHNGNGTKKTTFKIIQVLKKMLPKWKEEI